MHFLRTDHLPHHHAVCAHCHQRIVEVDEVGWVDPDGGDSYDLCPGDPYGNHEPQATQP